MNNNSSNIYILSVTEYRFGLKFTVQGETDKYIIRYDENKGWFCPCLDYYFRNHACKHIRACIDFIYDLYGVRLPDNVWCDDPKSDIVVNGESATSHTLVEEAVKNGSYY